MTYPNYPFSTMRKKPSKQTFVAEGIPVVGTEPSCLAVWRSDALELLADDPRVAEVARQTFTLAEFLARDDETDDE